jgi:hypothetical protein
MTKVRRMKPMGPIQGEPMVVASPKCEHEQLGVEEPSDG